jgi:hypothetical protein
LTNYSQVVLHFIARDSISISNWCLILDEDFEILAGIAQKCGIKTVFHDVDHDFRKRPIDSSILNSFDWIVTGSGRTVVVVDRLETISVDGTSPKLVKGTILEELELLNECPASLPAPGRSFYNFWFYYTRKAAEGNTSAHITVASDSKTFDRWERVPGRIVYGCQQPASWQAKAILIKLIEMKIATACKLLCVADLCAIIGIENRLRKLPISGLLSF